MEFDEKRLVSLTYNVMIDWIRDYGNPKDYDPLTIKEHCKEWIQANVEFEQEYLDEEFQQEYLDK